MNGYGVLVNGSFDGVIVDPKVPRHFLKKCHVDCRVQIIEDVTHDTTFLLSVTCDIPIYANRCPWNFI
jgi:hypothetical protein